MKTKMHSRPEKFDNDIVVSVGMKKYSLVSLTIFVISSFGETIFSHLFGMDFGEAVKKVLVENAPLTIAASIISVRIYSIRKEDINFPFEFMLCSLILCAAGYVTQLVTGHEIFRDAYEQAQHSNYSSWELLGKIAVAARYTVTGYVKFYGITETLTTLVAGAAIPWAMLHKYKEYSAKISEGLEQAEVKE